MKPAFRQRCRVCGAGLAGRTLPLCHTARSLENHDFYRRAQALGNDRPHGARRRHERRDLPGLCRAGSGANAQTGRHRRHGQSTCPRGRGGGGMPSSRPIANCVVCRPTVQASTRSKTLFPRSKRIFAPELNALSARYGTPVAKCSSSVRIAGVRQPFRCWIRPRLKWMGFSVRSAFGVAETRA